MSDQDPTQPSRVESTAPRLDPTSGLRVVKELDVAVGPCPDLTGSKLGPKFGPSGPKIVISSAAATGYSSVHHRRDQQFGMSGRSGANRKVSATDRELVHSTKPGRFEYKHVLV